MPPVGIEPTSSGLQPGAMTTSAKAALNYWGETGNRTLSNCFTDSCAATTLVTPLIGSEQGIRTLVPLYGTHSLAGRHD